MRFENIVRYDEYFVSKLLVEDGACRGVAALDIRTGEYSAILGRRASEAAQLELDRRRIDPNKCLFGCGVKRKRSDQPPMGPHSWGTDGYAGSAHFASPNNNNCHG